MSEALLFGEHGGEHVVYRNCSECQKQFLYTTCSPHVLSLDFSCIELVIQWTICRHIVDAKIRASDKDLPVLRIVKEEWDKKNSIRSKLFYIFEQVQTTTIHRIFEKEIRFRFCNLWISVSFHTVGNFWLELEVPT